MTVYLEEEGNEPLPLDVQQTASLAAEAALEILDCPYEAEVNLLLTDDPAIREMNRSFRGIDCATDVLSFPMAEYPAPGDFSRLEADCPEVFDPDSGRLVLGDIVISKNRVLAQAQEYGHSPRREFAFLVVHSMLHLAGYDHMEEEERLCMEEKQREIMERINIPRSPFSGRD